MSRRQAGGSAKAVSVGRTEGSADRDESRLHQYGLVAAAGGVAEGSGAVLSGAPKCWNVRRQN
jgi:hypothetical protein